VAWCTTGPAPGGRSFTTIDGVGCCSVLRLDLGEHDRTAQSGG